MSVQKISIQNELRSLTSENPAKTMGEIIYSFTRPQGNKERTDKLSDLLKLTDNEILTAIEKAREIEKDG